MSVRTRVLDEARERARVSRRDIGAAVRSARMAAGLSVGVVAAAAGRSPSWVSRVERGMVRGVAAEDLIVLGAAVGLKVWIAAFPAERAIHDAPQLSLLRRFRARVGDGWTWQYEAVVPVAGDRRAADAVISRGSLRVAVEAFTRLADVQAQLRAVQLKARDLGVRRIVVVVAATHANRGAMALAEDVVAANFPLGTRAVLAALRAGRDPGANGVVVL